MTRIAGRVPPVGGRPLTPLLSLSCRLDEPQCQKRYPTVNPNADGRGLAARSTAMWLSGGWRTPKVFQPWERAQDSQQCQPQLARKGEFDGSIKVEAIKGSMQSCVDPGTPGARLAAGRPNWSVQCRPHANPTADCRSPLCS